MFNALSFNEYLIYKYYWMMQCIVSVGPIVLIIEVLMITN